MSEAGDMIGELLVGFADKLFNSNAGVIFTKNYGLLPNDIFYSTVLKPVEYVVDRIPNFSLAGWWVTSTGEIADRINEMLALLDTNILWLNPDCGLQTRKHTEVKPALQNMVTAAKLLRTQLASTK